MTTINPIPSEELANARPNPQKRNLLIQRLGRLPWWVLIILAGILLFAISVADNSLYERAWNQVQRGIWVTIWVTLVAYTISLMMGLTIALLRRPAKSLLYNLLVYQPVTVYVEVVRGIPTLVLVLYIVAAGTPQLVSLANELGAWMQGQNIGAFGLAEEFATLRTRDIPEVYRAIAALAISYSAFLSEVFRAGIESIPKGQREAARSLGMSGWQVNRHIVLPQAIRNILPPLGNDFIAMLKESSLVSVVGVEDITRQGSNFRAATLRVFEAYNIIALTYLSMTLALSLFVKALETYLGRGKDRE